MAGLTMMSSGFSVGAPARLLVDARARWKGALPGVTVLPRGAPLTRLARRHDAEHQAPPQEGERALRLHRIAARAGAAHCVALAHCAASVPHAQLGSARAVACLLGGWREQQTCVARNPDLARAALCWMLRAAPREPAKLRPRAGGVRSSESVRQMPRTVALQRAFTRSIADAYLSTSSRTQHTPSDINRAPVVYPVPAQAAPPVFTIVK